MCGKSFATSSHYHYHIRSHSGEKPYRCDFCGKMYTASGSLRLHLKSHLSRLAANAFSSINLPSYNTNVGNMNESLMVDPLHVAPEQLKVGIKQEVFEHGDTGEVVTGEGLPIQDSENNNCDEEK